MNARTIARLAGALMLAVVLSTGAVGCAKTAKKPTLPLQEPAALPSGAIPGIQFVAESALSMQQKADVDSWQSAGAPASAEPTIKVGSFTPTFEATDVTRVEVSVGSSNGIQQKVVTFTFTPTSSTKLADYTARHVGETLIVVLNDKAVAALPITGSNTSGALVVGGDSAVTDALTKAVVPE